MKNNDDIMFWLMFGFLVILFFLNCFFIVEAIKFDKFKKQAIELGYAEHNPYNGVWQWKPPVNQY